MIGNTSSLLMVHEGEFLTAGLCGAQWVTRNKGMTMEQALCSVAGTDGSILKNDLICPDPIGTSCRRT